MSAARPAPTLAASAAITTAATSLISGIKSAPADGAWSLTYVAISQAPELLTIRLIAKGRILKVVANKQHNFSSMRKNGLQRALAGGDRSGARVGRLAVPSPLRKGPSQRLA